MLLEMLLPEGALQNQEILGQEHERMAVTEGALALVFQLLDAGNPGSSWLEMQAIGPAPGTL